MCRLYLSQNNIRRHEHRRQDILDLLVRFLVAGSFQVVLIFCHVNITCITKVVLVCLGFSALSADFCNSTVNMTATATQTFFLKAS